MPWLTVILAVSAIAAGSYTVWIRGRRFAALNRRHSMRRLFRAQRRWHLALLICLAMILLFGREAGSLAADSARTLSLAVMGAIVLLEIVPASMVWSWQRESERGGWLRVNSASLLSAISLLQVAGLLFVAAELVGTVFRAVI